MSYESYEMQRLKVRLEKAVARVAAIQEEILQCERRNAQKRAYTKIEHRARAGWRGEISRS